MRKTRNLIMNLRNIHSQRYQTQGRMLKRALVAALMALSILIPAMPMKAASRPQSGPVELEGEINGAPYSIRVPTNWNGTLLVYAHGYRFAANRPGEVEDRTPYPTLTSREFRHYTDMEEYLLTRGYGLAGSAFSSNGPGIYEGIADTEALTRFFIEKIGQPRRTILFGFSGGAAISYELMERAKTRGLYDGAICGCGVSSGTALFADRLLDFTVAYDVAFGWPASWGTPGDARDDLDFPTEVVPVLVGQLQKAENFGRFEFLRLVTQMPREGYYDGTKPAPWLFMQMLFATEVLGDMEKRAGGPVTQNLDHTYRLTDAEKSYLATLGVDADSLLSAMNARRNISAPKPSRKYLKNMARFDGKIKKPIISIHEIYDGLAPVSAESIYREINVAAGRQDLLLQVFTDGVAHCSFTQEQLLSAVKAMESWIDTGRRPGAEFFPDSLGFVPNFVPPAWPQP